MATTKRHLSFFWGALDVDSESTSTPYYAPTDYVTLGDDATVGGGIGVRRATLVLDRSAYSTSVARLTPMPPPTVASSPRVT